jgi:hypothetical protein
MCDPSRLFAFFLHQFMEYETITENNPDWQKCKKEYYTIYCSMMSKVHQLVPGSGFHLWSIVPKQYAEDNVTIMINPDVDALMTFCMSLHETDVYTEWSAGQTHWLVFIYKKL